MHDNAEMMVSRTIFPKAEIALKMVLNKGSAAFPPMPSNMRLGAILAGNLLPFVTSPFSA